MTHDPRQGLHPGLPYTLRPERTAWEPCRVRPGVDGARARSSWLSTHLPVVHTAPVSLGERILPAVCLSVLPGVPVGQGRAEGPAWLLANATVVLSGASQGQKAAVLIHFWGTIRDQGPAWTPRPPGPRPVSLLSFPHLCVAPGSSQRHCACSPPFLSSTIRRRSVFSSSLQSCRRHQERSRRSGRINN